MTHSFSYMLLLKGCLDDNQHVQRNFVHLKRPFWQRRNFGKFSYMHAQSLLDCSPPGSSIHEILPARILEWVAMPSSRASSWPRDQTHFSGVPCTCRWILCHKPPVSKASWKFYEILNKYQRKFEFLSPQVERYLLNISLFEIRAALKAVSFYWNSLCSINYLKEALPLFLIY